MCEKEHKILIWQTALQRNRLVGSLVLS